MIEIEEKDSDKEVLECELPVFACFPTCLVADGLGNRYDGQLNFIRMDKDKAPEIADKYQFTVVPSKVIFQDSQIRKKLLGYQDKLTLRDLLDSLLIGLPSGSIDEV